MGSSLDQNKYIPKIYLYLNWYYGSSWGINDAPIKNPSIAENSYDSYEKGYYAGIGFNWKFDGGASFFNGKSKRLQESHSKRMQNLQKSHLLD